MNTGLSGSARIDSAIALPSGELRGRTKVIKITEDVRKYAAEQGIGEEAALESGMQEKRKEFAEQGAEIYAKA
ncbi:MAG: hypothetical protein H0W43_10710 [Chthoniobacterales bacterium]|jgi:phosphomethylpyrimidine synthase|nr:hypothetical protein [Chthoniobacterales bacterium]